MNNTKEQLLKQRLDAEQITVGELINQLLLVPRDHKVWFGTNSGAIVRVEKGVDTVENPWNEPCAILFQVEGEE